MKLEYTGLEIACDCVAFRNMYVEYAYSVCKTDLKYEKIPYNYRYARKL